MFAEEISQGCGLHAYYRNMRIVHATSSTPAGPYHPVNLATSTHAETPHAVRDPTDGSWLIFLSGCARENCLTIGPCSNGFTPTNTDMDPCPKGRNSSSESSLKLGHTPLCTCPKPGHEMPGPECSVDATNVLRATSPDGPWTMAAPVLDQEHPAKKHADGTPWMFSNPSGLVLKNGTALVMYRDFLPNEPYPHTNVIGLAASDNGWKGPYTRFQPLIVPDANEDPHIYVDKRGNLHMIAHYMCDQWPNCPDVVGHAASADGGLTWHFSGGAAYTTTVKYEDGSSKTYSRRERPEMLVNEHGEPTHLITGVVEHTGEGQNDYSWTLVQPVRTSKPPPSPPPQPTSGTITLFENGGDGKLVLDESDLAPNSKSGRRGALAWDSCKGAKFDNGHPVHVDGSEIGHIQLSGEWTLLLAESCAMSYDYGSITITRNVNSKDGKIGASQIVYFEVASNPASVSQQTII